MKSNMNQFKTKLDSFLNNTAQTIQIGSIGVIDTDDTY